MATINENNEPMIFKYCSPERVDILENGFMRLTQPICFNDIFESEPVPDYGVPNFLEQNIDNFDAPKVFAETIKGFSGLNFFNKYKYTYRVKTGIICFSEYFQSLLMWAHYTNDYKGFVFGCNPNDSFFDFAEEEDWALRKITYSKLRPKLSARETVEKQFDGEILRKWFAIKSNEWSYEREWRVIKFLTDNDKVIESSPYPIHLAKINVNKVKCILVGFMASNELKVKLIRLSKKYNIKLYFQFRHLHNYELIFTKSTDALENRIIKDGL